MDDSTEVGLHAAASSDLKLLNPVISSSILTAGLKYLPLTVLCSRLRRTQAKLYGEDDMCLISLRMLTKGEFREPAVLGHLHFRTDDYSAFTTLYPSITSCFWYYADDVADELPMVTTKRGSIRCCSPKTEHEYYPPCYSFPQ